MSGIFFSFVNNSTSVTAVKIQILSVSNTGTIVENRNEQFALAWRKFCFCLKKLSVKAYAIRDVIQSTSRVLAWWNMRLFTTEQQGIRSDVCSKLKILLQGDEMNSLMWINTFLVSIFHLYNHWWRRWRRFWLFKICSFVHAFEWEKMGTST